MFSEEAEPGDRTDLISVVEKSESRLVIFFLRRFGITCEPGFYARFLVHNKHFLVKQKYRSVRSRFLTKQVGSVALGQTIWREQICLHVSFSCEGKKKTGKKQKNISGWLLWLELEPR